MMNSQRAISTALLLTLSSAALLSACKDEGTRAYRAPDAPQGSHTAQGSPATTPGTMPSSAPGGMGSSPAGASLPGAGDITVDWTVPQGWQELKTDQPMRVATFKAPGAGTDQSVEVTVSAFPGDVGGMLANINRWRGQLQLQPITEAELPNAITTTTHGSTKVSIASIDAPNSQRMLGSVITPGDGKTWFAKATTSVANADALKASFTAFSQSFKLKAGTTANPHTGAMPSGAMGSQGMDLPPASPGMPGGFIAGGDVTQRLNAWKGPANWKADTATGGIVAAAFNIENAAGGARATATSLRNDGGGALPNINRWRGQLGMDAVSSLEQQPHTKLGEGSYMVDLTDPGQKSRMIAAGISADGATWFFKLTGAPAAVEAEKAAFENFVKQVGLGQAGGK